MGVAVRIDRRLHRVSWIFVAVLPMVLVDGAAASMIATPFCNKVYLLFAAPSTPVSVPFFAQSERVHPIAQPRGTGSGSLPVPAAAPPIDVSRWFVEPPLAQFAYDEVMRPLGTSTTAPSGPSPFHLGLFGLGLLGLWRAWSAAARR
jgi:hypothetical protein